MTQQRAWSLIIPTAAVLLAGVLWLDVSTEPLRLVAGAIALATLVAGWFVVGVRAEQFVVARFAMVAIIAISAGVLCAASPAMMFVQCIAYPLAWMTMCSLRDGVMASVVISLSVGIGYYVGLGAHPDRVPEVAIAVAISVGLSIVLGVWISRITDESEDRRVLLSNLESAQEELAAAHRDGGIHEERARLAREIHDTLAQDLTGIVMLAQNAARALDSGNSDGAREQISLVEESARIALGEARSLVAATAGGLGEGLETALTRLADGFTRETGIRTTVEVHDASERDKAQQVVLLRCAQESLANIRKHSGASTARLSLEGDTLTISDDGSGFDTDAEPQGFGLTGMRDRLALMGGSLAVQSGHRGTTITARLQEVHA